METNRTNDGANRGQFGITLLTMEFLLRLLRTSEGCLGCGNINENETEAASTRNESETSEPNTNRKRIQNATKTEPKCTKAKPKRTQNQPNGFKTIQSVPSSLKLAQVLTPRWPMSTTYVFLRENDNLGQTCDFGLQSNESAAEADLLIILGFSNSNCTSGRS